MCLLAKLEKAHERDGAVEWDDDVMRPADAAKAR